MRKVSLLFASVALFLALPEHDRLGPLSGAGVALLFGATLGIAASGAFDSLAAAGGAFGGAAALLLAPASYAASGATLLALAYAERTLRVRGRAARALHVGLAVTSGALGASLAIAYDGAPLVGSRSAALALAGLLATLPLLVEADDAIAHALSSVAATLPDDIARTLSEGAELRRSVRDVPLDRATARSVRRTWVALVRLVEARVRLERSRNANAPSVASPSHAVKDLIDHRIREHVAVLSRAYTATVAAAAAAVGLDDAALRTARNAGESHEDASRAALTVEKDLSSGAPTSAPAAADPRATADARPNRAPKCDGTSPRLEDSTPPT